MLNFFILKGNEFALAGEALWIDLPPVKQKVAGLSPCQGTSLGCRSPPNGGTQEATRSRFPPTLMFLASFSLPPLSQKKEKIFKKTKLKWKRFPPKNPL